MNGPYECYGCGGHYPKDSMVPIDVSREGEYYPRFIHVCLSCNNPDIDTKP